MTDNEKTIALHEIGVALSDAPTTERLLVQVRVYAGHPVESGAAGLVDIAHRDLRLAMSKLRILSPERLADVAGPEAKRAYDDFHAAYDGIEDAYGMACGPERTEAQAEAIRETLDTSATEALRALRSFHFEAKSLEIPTLAAFMEAMEGHRSERVARQPAIRQEATPRPVPEPFTGEETARRSRTVLGYAFGSFVSTYLGMRGEGNARTGMVALGDLSAAMPYITVATGSVTARAAREDRVFSAHAEAVEELHEELYEAFRAEIDSTGIPVEALDRLRDKTMECLRRASTRILRVEEMAAQRGYALVEEAGASPAP